MISHSESPRVGYVVKRYPRYSETFIVNEILQHERAGLAIDIFALRPVTETHFQDLLAAVRAPVTYLPEKAAKTSEFWALMTDARRRLPDFWRKVEALEGVDVNDLAQAVELALLARERGIVHLHAHFGTLAATVTRLAAGLAGLDYSLTLHAKDIYHASVDPALLHEKLNDAVANVTVSDFNRRYLARTYPGVASTVKRIYNGLDLTRFEYAPPRPNSREILAVGRLVEKKGFDVLVDACAILHERGVPFRCRIVGEGGQRANLQDRIDRLGLTRRVTLPGPQPHATLIDTFRQAAVVAAPCVIGADGDRDGLPTVLLEAMALGVPCVSTDVTGIPELVRDGQTGLCVPQRDPLGLADALARLLTDAAARERLSRNARALVEREFDVRRNTAELRELFDGCSTVSAPTLSEAR